MNVCEYKGSISVLMKFLNWCQDGREASVCLGIMLRNNDTSAECVSYMLCCNNSPFNCYDVGKLVY